jgi:hypothetical protein
MAQGFFKHIPDIVYDFKSDGTYYRAKDLFRKVSTWSYLQEGVSGYSYYRVIEGERPDVVASKLYGDSTLYWTFFLVNENLQDFNDWPKSNQLLEKYINRKYSGKCLVAGSSTDIVSSTLKFSLGEKVSQSSSGAYGFVTDVNPTHNRITLNSIIGIFTTGTVTTSRTDEQGVVLDASKQKSFTVTSIQNERDAVNHYTDSNELKTTVSTNNSTVTNETYERTLNEDKFMIRYIEPKYIGRIVKEFIDIVRD